MSVDTDDTLAALEAQSELVGAHLSAITLRLRDVNARLRQLHFVETRLPLGSGCRGDGTPVELYAVAHPRRGLLFEAVALDGPPGERHVAQDDAPAAWRVVLHARLADVLAAIRGSNEALLAAPKTRG